MKYKIVRDKDYLHKKTEPVSSVDEGNEIAKTLLKFLDENKFGIGLSAIQIGIPKSVSVVRVKKDSPPIILMNPSIIEHSKEKIVFAEGCLSLPGKVITTLRSQKIKISALNFANDLPFGPDVDPVTQESVSTDYGLLECICIQHEIDHNNGILIVDDGVRFITPQKKTIKYGRNDKVMIEKNGETQYIKYKKALELTSDGWKIL